MRYGLGAGTFTGSDRKAAMIIKITDGYTTHFIDCSGDVRVFCVPNVHTFGGSSPVLANEDAVENEPTAEWLPLINGPSGEVVGGPASDPSGIVIRPEGLPLRSYLTNWDAYLMSDKGKTVEVLHRMS